MDANEYQKLASRTESPIRPIHNSAIADRLVHVCLGLLTESGEFADTVKRFTFYGQAFDEITAKEELGDLLWYVALACNAMGLELSNVMQVNIDKLRNRFPQNFTAEDALEASRDRPAERNIVKGCD